MSAAYDKKTGMGIGINNNGSVMTVQQTPEQKDYIDLVLLAPGKILVLCFLIQFSFSFYIRSKFEDEFKSLANKFSINVFSQKIQRQKKPVQ